MFTSVSVCVYLTIFNAPSTALTNQQVIRQTISHRHTQPHTNAASLQKVRSEWDVFKEAFETDEVLEWQSCGSPDYNDFFTELPGFHMSAQRIPPNTQIFFYGHSYLNQILNNILIANGETLIRNGPHGGFEGDLIDTGSGEGGECYVTRWDFTVNSTIIQVQNCVGLQGADSADNLTKFMQEYPFDIAFFMNPHPDCYLVDHAHGCGKVDDVSPICNCKCHNLDSYNGEAGCSKNFTGDLLGERSDVSSLWHVIKEAVQGRVYEVEAWTIEPRDWFHADDENTIRTYPILAGQACNQLDNCSSRKDINGHQCQPGLLALVSELIVSKMSVENQ